jgi:hypothetical protein
MSNKQTPIPNDPTKPVTQQEALELCRFVEELQALNNGVMIPGAYQTGRLFLTDTTDPDAEGVDLTPVEALMQTLGEDCRKKSMPRGGASYLEQLEKLDEKQLRHLAWLLVCEVHKWARLYHSTYSEKHFEHVQKMWALKRAAKEQGFELWPEIDEE